jgi:hypothetical protein
MASQSYDIYLHSISKALYLTLDLDDSDEHNDEKADETIDIKSETKEDL